MRFAFAIVSLFPGGGLQRDCLAIAGNLRAQGHDVTLFAARVSDLPGVPVTVLPNRRRSNHGIQQAFAEDFMHATREGFDATVGFDKLMGLDVLYCADPCYAERLVHQPQLRLLPRYRTYRQLELDSFAPDSAARIIVLSQAQLYQYHAAWHTPPERMILLPPTVMRSRCKPEWRGTHGAQKYRKELGLNESDFVWIAVCVRPRTKGLDRVIRALAHFPSARLMVVGLNEQDGARTGMPRLARRRGVEHRISWLGHREDIPALMAASDLLVHPARYDTTGAVILEAVVNGLPVVTTAACGYASHVESAGAGIVLKEPFDATLFLAALDTAGAQKRRAGWSEAAVKYGQNSFLYDGHARAAEIIIATALDKQRGLETGKPRVLPTDG